MLRFPVKEQSGQHAPLALGLFSEGPKLRKEALESFINEGGWFGRRSAAEQRLKAPEWKQLFPTAYMQRTSATVVIYLTC